MEGVEREAQGLEGVWEIAPGWVEEPLSTGAAAKEAQGLGEVSGGKQVVAEVRDLEIGEAAVCEERQSHCLPSGVSRRCGWAEAGRRARAAHSQPTYKGGMGGGGEGGGAGAGGGSAEGPMGGD